MHNTVLVLDDDPMAVELAGCILEEYGYKVVPCLEGKEALEAFKTVHIDVALVDLALPDMRGKELIKRCRKIQRECKFIVISGHLDIREFIDLQELNVVDCFQKPVDMELVLKAISLLPNSKH